MTSSNRSVWTPIAPWHIAWHKNYLPEVFAELRTHLTGEDWHSFNQRCAREWSIETGQIENAFNLDRGVTLHLIREGFVSSLISHQSNGMSQEQVHSILMDTKEALEGLFDFVKSDEPLTTSYIRQLHQQLMASVDTFDAYFIDPVSRQPVRTKKKLEKGKYKDAPNSPLREHGGTEDYCPPEQTASQMDELVRIYNAYNPETPSEVRAAWLHHAFNQIHPFQDGNGRVARALASLVLIKGGLPALTVVRSMKHRYILSLEEADNGNPSPLVAFFESCLYRNVVGLWREATPEAGPSVSATSTIEEIIKAAQTQLLAKRDLSPVNWHGANERLSALQKNADGILQELAGQLTASLQQIDPSYRSRVARGKTPAGGYGVAALESWGQEMVANGYRAETSDLYIDGETDTAITAVFDPLSRIRKGLCGVAVVFSQGSLRLPIEPSFFMNFRESEPEERFASWLRESLRKAVIHWQDQAGK